ncbi:MAG: isopeptide-forming domain-containing fimbrial protein [Defluviitaleaceae bacterium]|nr:isopeptide-forming domain-containing fimbrial protein [Defluviitaleaceae bacterium]
MKKKIFSFVLIMAMVIAANIIPASAAMPPLYIEVDAPVGMSLDGQTISTYKVFDATWGGADGSSLGAFNYTLNAAFAGLPDYLNSAAGIAALGQSPSSFPNAGSYAAAGNGFQLLLQDLHILDNNQTYANNAALDPYSANGEALFRFGQLVNDYIDANHIAYTTSYNGATGIGDGQFFTSNRNDPTIYKDIYYLDASSKGLGYYLLTGSVPAMQQGDNPNDPASWSGKVSTAAVMFTNLAQDPSDGIAIGAPSIALVNPAGGSGSATYGPEGASYKRICLKLDVPTLDKKVMKDTTGSDGNAAGDGSYGISTDAKIGDTVSFQITASIPNMLGYAKNGYTYIVHDLLSAGLTLGSDGSVATANISVAVVDKNGNPVTGAPALSEGTDYVTSLATPPAPPAQPEETFTITFAPKSFYDNLKGYYGSYLQITYEATLNADALVSKDSSPVNGNPNDAWLEYSNNPSDYTKTNKTTKIRNNVYTFEFDVFKYFVTQNGAGDDVQNALAGAEFSLYKLSSGAVTPASGDIAAGKELKFTQAAGTSDYTLAVSDGSSVLTSGADGMINVKGLDDGYYALVETMAPNGYNKLVGPVMIEIKPEYKTGTGPNGRNGNPNYNSLTDILYYVVKDAAWVENDSNAQFQIENKTGFKLPESGGMGTTVLYIGGCATMLGALLLLVLRGRQRVKE